MLEKIKNLFCKAVKSQISLSTFVTNIFLLLVTLQTECERNEEKSKWKEDQR
jgi:hypothetical protein